MISDWKIKYYDLIKQSETNFSARNDAIELKKSEMPDKLFKFRVFNEYSLDNLVNDTVWLSKPSNYNDPFEFAEKIDNELLFNVWFSKNKASYLKEKLLKHPEIEDLIIRILNEKDGGFYDILLKLMIEDGISKDQAEKKSKRIFDEFSSIDMPKNIIHNQNMMTVCSFCESINNILMWSHYADEHKGFCMEYDLTRQEINQDFLQMLHPVIYSSNVIDSTYNYISPNQSKSFVYLLLIAATKYIDWEYEKEWRYIIPDSEEKNISTGCLSKVYLGLRMNEQYKKCVKSICLEKGIPVFETIPMYSSYNLEFLPIK